MERQIETLVRHYFVEDSSLDGKNFLDGSIIYTADGKHYIKNGDEFIKYGADIEIDDKINENSENPVQNKVIAGELKKVFQSVSDGKELIASAITDKGISTKADASFQDMANNIYYISSGGNIIKTTAKILESRPLKIKNINMIFMQTLEEEKL